MKKFLVFSLMVLSMIFLVSCGGDSKKEDKDSSKNGSEQTDDSGSDSSSDKDFTVDENIFEVPADQDNTAGAPCDPETFVEFCEGNAYVDCCEAYTDEGELQYLVRKNECNGETPVCFVSREKNEAEKREYNWAACYSSCEGENTGKGQACITYDNGYSFVLEDYRCIETSKGKLKFSEDETLCNSACSEDGKTCEIKQCDPAEDKSYCDENGILHECNDWLSLATVSFCENFPEEPLVCAYIENEDRFGCMSEPVD